MAKQSSVANHPQVSRIDSMLDDAVPYSEISTRFGLSLSAVGRYALSRKSQLSRMVAGEPTALDVVARLQEAADHAQEARRAARVAGSPVAQARALKVEADVLSKLIAELGITDLTVADFEEEARALAVAVARFVLAEPVSGRVLLQVMAEDSKLDDLRAQIRALREEKTA